MIYRTNLANWVNRFRYLVVAYKLGVLLGVFTLGMSARYGSDLDHVKPVQER